MREYEIVVIIQPEISEEGNKAILDRLDGILEKHGDVRLSCEDMGKRKLAYEIRKFHKGHYYVLAFLGQGKAIEEIERTLRLDESVLRFMTVVVNEKVADVEARKAAGAEFEAEQEKRASEKAAREAEEAAAREEAERQAAEERANALAAQEAAPAADTDTGGESEPAAAAPAEAAETAPSAPSADAAESAGSDDNDVSEEVQSA